MAGKPLNRLELRRQSEAAEPLDPMEDESDGIVEVDDEEVVAKPKKKAKAPAKAKAKTTRAAKPAARMKIVWVVMNDAYKAVGTFQFHEREAAEARAAELTAKGKGTHFIQRVKEEIPADAPGIGASIPRPEVAPSRAKSAAAKAAAAKPVIEVAVEEELDDDDDDEDEADVEEDSDDDD
jgi:hypothetical protein